MTNSTPAPFMFIVDTDAYSGNFERELCSWMTGVCGELDADDDDYATVNKARKELEGGPFWNEDDFNLLPNIVFHEPDEHGYLWPVTIVPTPGYWNDGAGNHYPDSSWKRKRKPNATKFPAYQSVGIFLCVRPSKDLMDMLIQRAKSFKGIFKIIGFRLIEQRLTSSVLETFPQP